ncbi:MAG: hypothetical protein ACHQHN_04270 [Sphingobacteriales bacterium]
MLNTQKSDFAKVPLFVIFNRTTIEQKKDSIYLSSGNVDQNGHPTPVAQVKYSLDGKLTERVFKDTLNLVSSFKWSDDHKTLIKNQTYSPINKLQEPIKKVQETWRLSDDGKELIIERKFESLNQTEVSYAIKAVYDKQ